MGMVLSLERIRLQCRRLWFDSWVGKIHWRRDKLSTLVFLGFPGDSDSKESTCNVGDLGWEDPLKKETVTHASILAENSMDRGAWQATVHGVTKSCTRLSHFHFHLLRVELKCSILANHVSFYKSQLQFTHMYICTLTHSYTFLQLCLVAQQ